MGLKEIEYFSVTHNNPFNICTYLWLKSVAQYMHHVFMEHEVAV
jgi:hypothetical protein